MLTDSFELSSMSVDELWSLHEEISAVLSTRILDQKRELEKRLAILSHSAEPDGMPSETRPAKAARQRRKYPEVLPKYRNPQTAETWSGRGKRPRWLISAMESGHSMEEFRIGK